MLSIAIGKSIFEEALDGVFCSTECHEAALSKRLRREYLSRSWRSRARAPVTPIAARTSASASRRHRRRLRGTSDRRASSRISIRRRAPMRIEHWALSRGGGTVRGATRSTVRAAFHAGFLSSDHCGTAVATPSSWSRRRRACPALQEPPAPAAPDRLRWARGSPPPTRRQCRCPRRLLPRSEIQGFPPCHEAIAEADRSVRLRSGSRWNQRPETVGDPSGKNERRSRGALPS